MTYGIYDNLIGWSEFSGNTLGSKGEATITNTGNVTWANDILSWQDSNPDVLQHIKASVDGLTEGKTLFLTMKAQGYDINSETPYWFSFGDETNMVGLRKKNSGTSSVNIVNKNGTDNPVWDIGSGVTDDNTSISYTSDHTVNLKIKRDSSGHAFKAVMVQGGNTEEFDITVTDTWTSPSFFFGWGAGLTATETWDYQISNIAWMVRDTDDDEIPSDEQMKSWEPENGVPVLARGRYGLWDGGCGWKNFSNQILGQFNVEDVVNTGGVTWNSSAGKMEFNSGDVFQKIQVYLEVNKNLIKTGKTAFISMRAEGTTDVTNPTYISVGLLSEFFEFARGFFLRLHGGSYNNPVWHLALKGASGGGWQNVQIFSSNIDVSKEHVVNIRVKHVVNSDYEICVVIHQNGNYVEKEATLTITGGIVDRLVTIGGTERTNFNVEDESWNGDLWDVGWMVRDVNSSDIPTKKEMREWTPKYGLKTQTTGKGHYMELPSIWENEKPANPENGFIIYNLSEKKIQYYRTLDDSWISTPDYTTGSTEGFVAKGGDFIGTYTANNKTYKYHTFLSSGTFSVSSGSKSVDVLIVAGGGGGGVFAGAGGGGGGMRTFTKTIGVNNWPVVVGAGGAGGESADVTAFNGGDTIMFSETATGGGGGGMWKSNTERNSGGDGGSGGGGGESAGDGISGQGYDGGDEAIGTVSNRAGGGGGGASAVGGDASVTDSVHRAYGGDGGDGTSNDYDGTSNTYAGGGGGGARSFNYSGADAEGGDGGAGGGGGGAAAYSHLFAAGAGGTGRNSGNSGKTMDVYSKLSDSTDEDLDISGGDGGQNTGGGGGGCAWGGGDVIEGSGSDDTFTGTGGNGGSGIVIIRYET